MWRILLDWPAFYGGEPDKTALAQMVAIQRDYQQAICAGGDVFTVGGADSEVATDELAEVQARLAQFLQRTVFAQSPSEWLKLQEPQVFQTWAGQQRTIAARLIDHVFDSGWCASGSCNSLALPVIEYNLLAEAMQDSAFISQPQWRGHCCETTSLTRRDSPLLKNIESRYRNGLLMRLAAHLTEVAQIAEEMAISSSTAGRPGQPPSAAYFRRGIGRVAAARGELVHRVDLAHGAVPEKTVIDDYRILAPTEWNFHPQGIVNKALCSLKGDLDQVKRQAKLLITTIDPCVAFDLVIIEETQ
jgi:hypothetical protein